MAEQPQHAARQCQEVIVPAGNPFEGFSSIARIFHNFKNACRTETFFNGSAWSRLSSIFRTSCCAIAGKSVKT
jgi:hypothetical protein